jgi:hypothetical protein
MNKRGVSQFERFPRGGALVWNSTDNAGEIVRLRFWGPTGPRTIDVPRVEARATVRTPEVRPLIVLVPRENAQATVRPPTVAKAVSIGRENAQATVRTPTVAKARSVARENAQATVRTPTASKATGLARAQAQATTRAPTVEVSGGGVAVDVVVRALARATVRAPSVDAVLGRCVANARIVSPLPAVYGRSRPGSARFGNWRRL